MTAAHPTTTTTHAAPGTVRSTTGTAPVTFTAVEPAGTVRIDLADGSSQVYDTRAVSRALSEASIGATVAEFGDMIRATAHADSLGDGRGLGYGPSYDGDALVPSWATLSTPWTPIAGTRSMTRMVRRTFGDGSVAVDAVQDLASRGSSAIHPAEVSVNVNDDATTDPAHVRDIAAWLVEAAALLEYLRDDAMAGRR